MVYTERKPDVTKSKVPLAQVREKRFENIKKAYQITQIPFYIGSSADYPVCYFEWLTKLNSDIQAAFIMMNGPVNIPHLAAAVINTALFFFLLLKCSTLLFGITWTFILPQLWVNYQIVLRPVPELKEESQKALSENTSAIRPLIAEAEMIRSYDAGILLLKVCDESSRKLMKINMKMQVRKGHFQM